MGFMILITLIILLFFIYEKFQQLLSWYSHNKDEGI